MVVHGLDGQKQLRGDLRVGLLGADQVENLMLAPGQPERPLPGGRVRAGRDRPGAEHPQALPDDLGGGSGAPGPRTTRGGPAANDGRGILVNGWKDKAEKVVKLKDWNDLELRCEGDHINLKVNGVETADLHDSEKLSGIFALQLHQGPPMEVYFRNIEIKVLKAK